jgi:hypothetical protein
MRIMFIGKRTDLSKIDAEMERLIEKSGIYLFDVVCDSGHFKDSLGEDYAELRGAPVVYEKGFEGCAKAADYAFIVGGSEERAKVIAGRLAQYNVRGKWLR